MTGLNDVEPLSAEGALKWKLRTRPTPSTMRPKVLHIRCMIRPDHTRSRAFPGGHGIGILLREFRTVAFEQFSKPPHSATLPPLRRAEIQFTTVGLSAVTASIVSIYVASGLTAPMEQLSSLRPLSLPFGSNWGAISASPLPRTSPRSVASQQSLR